MAKLTDEERRAAYNIITDAEIETKLRKAGILHADEFGPEDLHTPEERIEMKRCASLLIMSGLVRCELPGG